MGTVIHRAVVVTTWAENYANMAREKAVAIFGPERVSPLIPSEVNGYLTVFIASSGSKLGWDTDDIHQKRIIDYRAALRKHDYDDGSSPFDFVCVEYGETTPTAKALR